LRDHGTDDLPSKQDDLTDAGDIPLDLPDPEPSTTAIGRPTPKLAGDPDWMPPKRPLYRSRLAAHVTLLDVSTKFGLDFHSFNGSHYRCPFHVDRVPSLTLTNSGSLDGLFYCHACKAGGDLICWVSKRLEVSDADAYLKVRELYGLGPDPLLKPAKPETLNDRVRLFNARGLTDLELEQLARSRHWDFNALRLRSTLLRIVPKYKGQKAYALRDRCNRNAVVRRFDGQLWKGDQKALNVPGSVPGIPIGVHEVAKFKFVALAEGGPDFFRAISLIHEQGYDSSILPIVMTSASATTIHPSVIAVFRAKRVRIFAHNDEPGSSAARKWKAQLEAAGADVDVWLPPPLELPDGTLTKDLDDLYFQLDPQIRSRIPELHDLLNFKVTLFEPPALREKTTRSRFTGTDAL
jgi:hypothetical protein